MYNGGEVFIVEKSDCQEGVKDRGIACRLDDYDYIVKKYYVIYIIRYVCVFC